MKTIFSKPFVWTVFVFLLSLLVSPANAQAPIKRGAAHKPAVTKNRTAGKHFTYRSTHRRARYYGGDYNDADSAAVDDGSLDSTATEGDGNTKFETYYMGGGYELFGRSKTYTDNADAQKSLREGLAKCDNPTTGCLTDHKALYISGGNGYNTSSLPQDMMTALRSCNANKLVVNDVCVTDVGWWAVVYSDTKYQGSLPSECKEKLDAVINKGEKILSLSISENGNYAFITDKSYSASNETDRTVIEVAIEKFGHANSVCITNLGTIVTCEKGALFWDVPTKVIEQLKSSSGTPKVIRFTDSGTFMAVDGAGFKAYYM